ncbi:serpin, putative [Brugia malayi]|uniref:Serpin, putative n=1 Tax=Brugia malayi TaxID=6279 RepID=A0A4E9F054_BRUMA|nr:serpin, putative [Brugia malayi]VIO89955.1 serpin, putative [Brugia malayi]
MKNQTITAIFVLVASAQFISILGQISLTERAQLDFAVSLLQNVAESDKSSVLSPFSVSTSLFIAYLAADGETKQQLQSALGKDASIPEFRLHFIKQLAYIAEAENRNYTLSVANRLYVREGLSVKESFQRVLSFYYSETLHKFSFGQRNELVQQINNWISSETNNKVRNMITENSITKDTRMLLMNAIHFKGTWAVQFIDFATKQKPFHISENETKLVPMMAKSDTVPYYEDDSVQVIKLPYIGDEVEMVIILPRRRFGLSDVLGNLSGEKLLKYVNEATNRSVSIKLPRFKVEEKRNLNSALQAIGITDAFSGNANFEELFSNSLPISIGKIIHGGFIEVNEKGTESAAATIIELEDRMGSSKIFNANQPFLFAIVKDLKTVLFLGQFVK